MPNISATPLHHAAESGKAEKVRELLVPEVIDMEQAPQFTQSRWINVLNKFGKKALRYFKALYSDPDKCIKHPLFNASVSHKASKAREVLKDAEYSINCMDSMGWTPLHYACAAGDLDMVTMFVSEFKADTTVKDGDGLTAVMLAALAGKEEIVNTMIGKFQCPVNDKDNYGNEVLAFAIAEGHTSLVRSLIQDHSADLNAKYDEDSTPLHVAAYFGKYEVALTLIEEFGCDIYVGRPLLHTACDGGNVDLVRYLVLTRHVDVNTIAVEDNNFTPVLAAAWSGKKEVVQALIEEFNCDINVRTTDGLSLLHHACVGGNVDLVRTLIVRYDADANDRDHENDTPLHLE